MEKLFDVLAVNFETYTVKFMAEGKTERNAEAVERMAIMRRGVEEDFYVSVPAGMYKEGEKWTGDPKAEAE